jgi:hypothetical protein
MPAGRLPVHVKNRERKPRLPDGRPCPVHLRRGADAIED